ncbi:MAG: penicillin-binding protein 2 [Puniceicoccaceae bacterium]|nr:MAG: penicillin-binding protein 2 [Puniceicoccaceae bacterium]
MNRSRFACGYRHWLVFLTVLVGFVGVGYRLVHLQVVQGEQLRLQAESLREQHQTYAARRGNIRDSAGQLLATSSILHDYGVDQTRLHPADRRKLPELAELLQIPLPELERLIYGFEIPRQWLRLKRGVDDDTHRRISALDFKGVYGNRYYERVYPGRSMAAHVIGYLNRESTPVTGVERHFDFYLRGQNGWGRTILDGRRNEQSRFRDVAVAPRDGLDVILSLDRVVQHHIEEQITALVDGFRPDGVTVIVSRPADGFILGLGNYPTFDLNHFNRAPLEHQRNRAVTDVFEPGSTFKIVPTAAALELGLVNERTLIDCSLRSLDYRGRRVGLPSDVRSYGTLSLPEVVAKSSNSGTAQIGLLLGRQALHDYASAFGFGEPTGYPLGGEVRGILHPVSAWDGLTITRLPIGHAVSATPLQVHFAMCAIANGGLLMQPQVVRRIEDGEGRIVLEVEPVFRRRVVSRETAQRMSRLLAGAVSTEGTASRAALPNHHVAGKTGTTQKIVDGRYSRSQHIATFSGFFPAERPEVAITVVVDNPRHAGTGYGGLVAAPAFRDLALALINHLNIPPSDLRNTYVAFERNPADRLP